jgi:Tol biopolymer transport system component
MEPVAPTDTPVSDINDQDENNQPIPDEERGLQIAYVKNGNVWIWDKSDGVRKLTNSGKDLQVFISPDGLEIAIKRGVGEIQSELWAVSVDGSSERRLISTGDLEALEPEARNPASIALVPHSFAWIPGTHILAYNTQQIYDGPGLDIMNDLRLVDVDTLQASNLLRTGEGGEFYFSPDGSKVAIVTPTAIDLMAADGSERTQALVYDEVITYSEFRYYAHPQWSSDSSLLRVAIPASDPMAPEPGPSTLWQIPGDGQSAVQLGTAENFPFSMYAPRYSPDLSRIAYIIQTDAPEEQMRELRIASYDGSDSYVYTQGFLVDFVAWTASSDNFMYVQGDPAQLFYAQLDGESKPFNQHGDGFTDVTWVDEENYIYIIDVNGTWELGLSDLSGNKTLIDNITGLPPAIDFKK